MLYNNKADFKGVIKIPDNSKKQKNKPYTNQKKPNSQMTEKLSQVGKSPEEILPYLLSGESDDLSIDFTEKL